jgi:glycosyltransferase involved in cell wall biosynthesis
MTLDLTIITPVFNGEKYIEETILSVLSKMRKSVEYEYIIVDDGSTDGTSRILEKYTSNPIVKVVHQENQGEAAAINVALSRAQGSFATVLSADDPMLTGDLAVEALLIFRERKDIVCIYPDWRMIDINGSMISERHVKDYSEMELIGLFNCLPGPGAFFRVENARNIGGRRNWKFVSDYDFWLRLSQEGIFIHIPRVLAQWRSHENSTSISMKSLAMGLERINVIKDFVQSNEISPKMKRISLSSAYYYASRLGFFSGEVPAKKWLLKSFYLARGWPTVATPLVVFGVLGLPFTRIFSKMYIGR